MSNLALRILTAAIAAPLLLALLLRGPFWAWRLFIGLVAAAAATELMRMVLPEAPRARALGLAVALALHASLTFPLATPALVSVLLLLTVVALLAGVASPTPPAQALHQTAWLVAGPCYAGALTAPLALLAQPPLGAPWVVLAMLLAWLGDTGAYFAGRAFGRHKLLARISPNKTWEGSVGGLLGSASGAVLAHFTFLPALPLASGLALACVGGALGQLGDYCESLIKRAAGCKDSGRIVPGHGGMLDRIDALMFTATATWLYATWLR